MAQLQGLIVNNNFAQTRIQFNELITYMNTTLKTPLALNINVGQISQQLQQVASQTEKLRSSMNLNMNVGANTGGLDKMMTTTRTLNGEIANIASTVVKVSSNMNQTVQTTEKFNKVLENGVLVEKQMGATVTKTTDNYKAQLAVKEKSIAMGENALVERENIALTKATSLMTQKLNLEQQIKVANESGNLPLEQSLALRREEVALQLQSASANLGNASDATKVAFLQREVEIKTTIGTANAKILGQGQQEATEIQRRIALYQREKELQVSGMTQKYGSSVDTASLNQATQAYRQLGSAGITSLSELNAKEQQINMGLKEVGANARVASNALKQVGGLSGAFNSLLSNMKSMAVFSLTAGAIFGTVNAIKEGIGASIEMDSTLATLSITMNGTKSDFQAMAKEIQTTAIATGSTVTAVSEASKIYANMGETASSILEKTKSAIMLSNVSGLDTGQTTDSVHAILNQFNTVGETASITSEHVANSLVAISKNMAMDFGAGIEEITKGIQVVGTVSTQTAKLSSDETEAMIGAIVEKTRLGGEQVGNGLIV